MASTFSERKKKQLQSTVHTLALFVLPIKKVETSLFPPPQSLLKSALSPKMPAAMPQYLWFMVAVSDGTGKEWRWERARAEEGRNRKKWGCSFAAGAASSATDEKYFDRMRSRLLPSVLAISFKQGAFAAVGFGFGTGKFGGENGGADAIALKRD